ncbi:MAG: helix-turn-helix transcriptional regulator [Halobacteriota archaeon]
MSHHDEARTADRSARDDIEFLAGSWNRLEVLSAIADEPTSRADLRDRTAVSRVTLSRILSDLEARGWIARPDGEYEATATGAYLCEEVTRLLENVRTLNRLGENVEWMRLGQFDFDLRHLDDADLIMPTWDDFSAQTRQLVDRVYESTSIRGVGTGLDREFTRALLDATRNHGVSLELIYTPEVIEAANGDPDLARLFRDLADAPGATVYRYGGNANLMELGLLARPDPAEDLVMICGEYDEGAPPGTVETSDPRVRTWAESFFDDRLGESHQLTAAVFTV